MSKYRNNRGRWFEGSEVSSAGKSSLCGGNNPEVDRYPACVLDDRCLEGDWTDNRVSKGAARLT